MFYWTQFIKNIISTTNQYKNYWYLDIFIQNLWNPVCILHLGHILIQKLNSLEILNLSLDFIRLTVGKVDSHIQVISNISLVQSSHSVVSDSSWPHGLHQARLPYPSSTPEACSNSCPSSRWCHPTISSSVVPFSSCLQSFPASGSFQMSPFFTWCEEPKYWSFSFSISPSNEYSGLISFRVDWVDFLVLQGTLKSLLQHHSSKASILRLSAFFIVQLYHPYMTTGKTIALTRWTFVGKVMSLLFNMLSGLVITCLPRSKCLLIS